MNASGITNLRCSWYLKILSNLYKPLDECNLKEFSNIMSSVNLLEPSHDYSLCDWETRSARVNLHCNANFSINWPPLSQSQWNNFPSYITRNSVHYSCPRFWYPVYWMCVEYKDCVYNCWEINVWSLLLTFKCCKMLLEDGEARRRRNKRDLVVASTRHHRVRLLKYYPRRPCAPSFVTSRMLHPLQTHFLLFQQIFFVLVCIHLGTPRVSPRVLASGPKPCGAIRDQYKYKAYLEARC